MGLLLALLTLISVSFGESVTVAVASSLRPPIEEIAELFEKNKGVEVRLSFGSSGTLYRQILGGAPYDLFLSASRIYAEELVRRKRAVKESLTIFARGRLAVFSLNRKVKGLESLLEAERVAVANPKFAPYGTAALEALRRSGFYEKLKKRLVYGSNVGQAFQFIVSGGADYGLVSLSLIKAFGRGNYRLVPANLYSPVEHAGVITERGSRNPYASEFLRFLKSEEAKRILDKFGFEVP